MNVFLSGVDCCDDQHVALDLCLFLSFFFFPSFCFVSALVPTLLVLAFLVSNGPSAAQSNANKEEALIFTALAENVRVSSLCRLALPNILRRNRRPTRREE